MLFVLPISVLYIVPLVGGALVCAFYRYRISCPRCWGGVILSESVQTQSNPQPYPTRWYTRIRRPSPIDTTRILPKDVLVSGTSTKQ
jgi:hypothetical protein